MQDANDLLQSLIAAIIVNDELGDIPFDKALEEKLNLSNLYILIFKLRSNISSQNRLAVQKDPLCSRLVSSDPIDHNLNYILEKSFKTYVLTGWKFFEKTKDFLNHYENIQFRI